MINVYLEIGKKKAIACALDWPGWARGGRDEAEALASLLAYGPRYARAMQLGGVEFTLPGDHSELVVVERLEGNASTDFGAPGRAPSGDTRPVDAAEVQRLSNLLRGCWQVLDQAAQAAAAYEAAGQVLRKGPRGGGRDLNGILGHVLGADQAYLARISKKPPARDVQDLPAELEETRQIILAALAESTGKVFDPNQRGPRGGERWPPRVFVRQTAWHTLDHAWEIEDRMQ